MGTRDKKIKGIPYENFVSIDKGKNGCYVLKKIDGDVLEIKLPENQAGGLRNHLRRAVICLFVLYQGLFLSKYCSKLSLVSKFSCF